MDVPKHVIREVVRRDKVFRNPDRMDARAKRRREEHEALPAVAKCAPEGCRRTVSPRYRASSSPDPYRCTFQYLNWCHG